MKPWRAWIGVLAGLGFATVSAGAAGLTGYVQASYGRLTASGRPRLDSEREQARFYLRDRLLVKSDWTLEYGFDRSREIPGAKPSFRPRYATSLRGSGYMTNFSFTPVRDDPATGGVRSDEWRGSLSVSGERYPQIAVNYFRKDDKLSKGSFTDSWLSSIGLQRTGLNMRGQVQGQRQKSPERNIDTRSLTGRGSVGLTRDFGAWARTAAGYDGAFGRRETTGPESTNQDHTGTASLGITPVRWLDWSSNGSLRWGESGRAHAMSQSHDQLLSTTLTMSALDPVEFSTGYFRSRSEIGSSETLQESVTAGVFGRRSIGELQYLSGQFTGGRQLASTVGRYDFVTGRLEAGGQLYRSTTYRLAATAQRNAGGEGSVFPLQATRQAVIDTEPFRSFRISTSYSASYAGRMGGGIRSNVEVVSFGLSAQPRSFGSWSGTYMRSWTKGQGLDRLFTLFASMRGTRGVGLSLGYTRRSSPIPLTRSTRTNDSLQGRVEVELRNELILSLSRDESLVRRPGGQVQWQGNLRWSF